MREELKKMMLYLDLVEQSEWKEKNLKESIYYSVFGRESERHEKIKRQKEVTKRLINRIQTLKIEL